MIKEIKEFIISPVRELQRFGSCKKCGIINPCKECNDRMNIIEEEICIEYRENNNRGKRK